MFYKVPIAPKKIFTLVNNHLFLESVQTKCFGTKIIKLLTEQHKIIMQNK